MQAKNNPSFFDPKTMILIATVGLIYVGWQQYLGHKYPNYGKPAAVVATQAIQPEAANTQAGAPVAQITAGDAVVVPQAQEFKYSNDKVSFTVTSKGMGIRDFTVLDYKDKHKENIKIGSSDLDSMFELRWAGDAKALNFNLTTLNEGHYKGVAVLGETEVIRELIFDSTTSSFKNTITVKNPTEEFKKGFSLVIPEKINKEEKTSFLFPSFQFQDFYVNHSGGKSDDLNFNNASEDVLKTFPNVSLASVNSQYFAAAIKDQSDIIPELRVTSSVAGKTALAELIYKPVQLKPEMVFNEIFYAGPKSIDLLKMVDAELADIINFGFFGFIARPLLYIMKAFHSLVGNWGLAIILLTLLVRLVVLPFNVMSFRSMKKMQKVQPLIQSIRDKYKEDPARLNQEMMRVMKENGANPLGGCLPMLLQIPIFFALYRVIGSSIELYNSPFILWITDLSSHDKFYVLPVSMAIFMYLQQKITPSTMDPTQAKVMAFMPVVFSLFMLQLPSGLTLYMVVSTLFGITQQYLIMREPSKAVTAK